MAKPKVIKKTIIDFINVWNKNFPIDFWWRKKYDIAFGSPEHRQMSFFDMLIDFEEQKLISISNFKSPEKENKDFISDEEFDNIDLDDIDDLIVK